MIEHVIVNDSKKIERFEWSLEKDPDDGTPRVLINGRVVFYVGTDLKDLYISGALIEAMGLSWGNAGTGPAR